MNREIRNRDEKESDEYNVFMQEVPPGLVQDDTHAHKVNKDEGKDHRSTQNTPTKFNNTSNTSNTA